MPVRDLLHPDPQEELRKHKLKRLVQSPNSFFMLVKCPNCAQLSTVYSHSQTVVFCAACATKLCTPTGGRARMSEGCKWMPVSH
ncbi:MAG: 40S ribosomal protein S27 [Cercozoa sp. M6MM]